MKVGLLSPNGSRSFRPVMFALAGLGLLLAAMPVIIVVVMSFSASKTPSFPPNAFSFRWYQKAIELLSADESGSAISIWDALTTSILTGALTMLISVLVCVPLAYALVRRGGTARQIVELLFTLPLVFPLVVLGIAFLMLAATLDADLGIWRLVIPHLALAMPFVLRNCLSAMHGIGLDIEEAAVSLGATPLRAAWDVVLPLMRPGILAGLIFAFIISFNEFTVTFFMYTIDIGTLPIWMYSRTVSSLDPATLALATIIILFDVTLIMLLDAVVARRAHVF